MLSNINMKLLLHLLNNVLFIFPILLIVGCATTQQFYNPSAGITNDNKELATIYLKRKYRATGSGWNYYVIDYSVKNDPNGIIALGGIPPTLTNFNVLFGNATTYVPVLFWTPDPVKVKRNGQLLMGDYKLTIKNKNGQFFNAIDLNKMELQDLYNFGILPKNSEKEIIVPFENSPYNVIFRQATFIGKLESNGNLSWKRPAGKFPIAILIGNGELIKSQDINLKPGEVKYIELDPNYYSGFKFNISDAPF